MMDRGFLKFLAPILSVSFPGVLCVCWVYLQTQTMPPQYMFITIFLCCILLHLLPLDYLHLFPLGLGLDRPLSVLEQRRGFFPLSVFHWKSLGGHYKSIGARPFIDYNDRLKRKHWMLTLLIMKISPLQKPIIN